jgi:NAD+ diphosphatase
MKCCGQLRSSAVTDDLRAIPLHRTVLSTGHLDRLHDRRSDEAWLAQMFDHEARVHVLWQGNVVLQERKPTTIQTNLLQSFDPSMDWRTNAVFLGELHEVKQWAVDLSHLDKSAVEQLLGEDTRIVSLRDAAMLLDEDASNVLAFSAGMGYWHRTHRYCGNCGAETLPTTGGHERKCTGCQQLHWPRTDPAVIMLVIDPVADTALLGRQKIWPKGMYSTLAGFVEPGESLEDAVARETWEEAAVRVGAVRYWCSQPWPFPRSVMLGFHAEYRSGTVTPHPTELDDARWFGRQELLDAREMGMRGNPMIPPPVTIARALLDAWLDGRVALS